MHVVKKEFMYVSKPFGGEGGGSTGKRARAEKRLDALLEAKKKRTGEASDSSSDGEDYFDRPVDKRS